MVVLVITHHVHVHGYGHGGSDGWRGGGGGGLGDGGCGGHGGLKKNSRRNLNAFKNKNNPFITRLKLKKLTYSSYVFENKYMKVTFLKSSLKLYRETSCYCRKLLVMA